MKTKFLPALAALLAVLWTSTGVAEEPATETVELTLHPAAETKPALRYHLLPTFLEQTPHNAAPLYNKAFLDLVRYGDKDLYEKVDKWLKETPLEKLPLDEVRETSTRSSLYYIKIAAHRARCEWDPPIRDAGTDLFGMLLPELPPARRAAELLALQARVQIAEGKLDEALGTIRTMYAFSRHMARQPLLISGLVAVAIAALANRELEHLIQAKQAPNLYWPLTDLPRPPIDLRRALEVEYASIYLVLPELNEARTAEHSDAEWDRLAEKMLGRLRALAPLVGDDKEWKSLLDKTSVDDLYPAARDRLLARGRDRKDVDAMPKSRVVLLDTIESFEEVRDELFKCFNLPYPQAAAQFDKAERKLRKAGEIGFGGQLAALLLPGIKAVNHASARGQRSIDALRCIEAIRMYAAAHGKLPEKLEDVKEAPIPSDVVTGEPFVYRLSDGVGVLELPANPPNPKYLPGSQRSKQYRLHLAK